MQSTAPVRVFASLMVMFAITAGLASAAEQRVQEVSSGSIGSALMFVLFINSSILQQEVHR
jgi:hypothetical protein